MSTMLRRCKSGAPSPEVLLGEASFAEPIMTASGEPLGQHGDEPVKTGKGAKQIATAGGSAVYRLRLTTTGARY